MFGECVRWIVDAGYLEKLNLGGADFLLNPQIGTIQVPYFSHTAASGNPDRRGRIAVDSQLVLKTQVAANALKA